jgi:hypothetical protein
MVQIPYVGLVPCVRISGASDTTLGKRRIMETAQKWGLVGDRSVWARARIAQVGRHVIGPMRWHHLLAPFPRRVYSSTCVGLVGPRCTLPESEINLIYLIYPIYLAGSVVLYRITLVIQIKRVYTRTVRVFCSVHRRAVSWKREGQDSLKVVLDGRSCMCMCTYGELRAGTRPLDHNRTTVFPTATATAVHSMYLLHMVYLLSKEKAVLLGVHAIFVNMWEPSNPLPSLTYEKKDTYYSSSVRPNGVRACFTIL